MTPVGDYAERKLNSWSIYLCTLIPVPQASFSNYRIQFLQQPRPSIHKQTSSCFIFLQGVENWVTTFCKYWAYLGERLEAELAFKERGWKWWAAFVGMKLGNPCAWYSILSWISKEKDSLKINKSTLATVLWADVCWQMPLPSSHEDQGATRPLRNLRNFTFLAFGISFFVMS